MEQSDWLTPEQREILAKVSEDKKVVATIFAIPTITGAVTLLKETHFTKDEIRLLIGQSVEAALTG